MNVTIENKSRKVESRFGTSNTSEKVAMMPSRITVNQFINDLYFSGKIDGMIYKHLQKETERAIKNNRPDFLGAVLNRYYE